MRWRILLLFLWPAVQSMADPFVRYEENGKVGLKDENGRVVIPATFEALGWSDGNFSVIGQITGYKLDHHWGLINLQKQFITPAEFEVLTYPGGDRLVASRMTNPFTIKYGCLDLSGKVTVPFRYDGIKVSGLRAVVFIKNGSSFEYGLIDLNDKGILQLRYRQVTPIGTLRYAVENDSLKTALFSEDGTQLTHFEIDSISSFRKGVAIVFQNFAQGIIGRDGEIKVQPIYREIKVDDEGEITLRDFDEWKILDEKNQEFRKIRADDLSSSGPGNYLITLARKTGLADVNLKMILPLRYDFMGSADCGNRVVGAKGKFGVIRKNNSAILAAEFDAIVLDRNFIRTAKMTNHNLVWSLYDTFGIEKTHSTYEVLGTFNGKFFPAKKRGYWGAINRYGEEIVNCVFDSILQFRDDRIAVKFRGEYGVIDGRETWILPPQARRITLINDDLYLEKGDSNTFLRNFNGETIYFTANKISAGDGWLREAFADGSEKRVSYQGVEIPRDDIPYPANVQRTFGESEGLRGIQKDEKFGFVDARGRLRIANRYDDIGEFHEGLAPIKLIGKWGYVSTNDQIVINPGFESVQPFINGVAIVQRGGKTGLIGKTGNAILPTRYDSITRLPDQHFLLMSSSLFGLADKNGNELIEPRFEQFQNLQNGYVIAGRQGKYGLMTVNGLSTIPMIYDQLNYDAASRTYLACKRSLWRKWRAVN